MFKKLVLYVLVSVVVLILVSHLSWAGTTGKISGVVRDKSTGKPLVAANVMIVGTVMGAATDDQGRYFILNVPPGTYAVKASMMGYESLTIENVAVYVDLTAATDFELKPTVVKVPGITVVAVRPLVEPTRTASETFVTSTEIAPLPVTNVSDLRETFAGIFKGHLRGGRSQDMVTLLDGTITTRLWQNTQDALGLNPYMISELSVLSGTFNAEYGEALAGMTRVVTKEGGSKFFGNLRWEIAPNGLGHKPAHDITVDGRTIKRENIFWDYDQEDQAGYSYLTNQKEAYNHYTPGEYDYYDNNKTKKPTQWLDWGLGGPLGEKMNWFASGRYYQSWGRFPREYSRLLNVFGKLTIRPTATTKLAISGMIEDQGWFSGVAQTRFDWSWKWNLENLNNLYMGTYLYNIHWTHAIDPSTYYEIKISKFADLYKEYNPKYGLRIPTEAERPPDIWDTAGYFIYGDRSSDLDPPIYDVRKFIETTISANITSQVTYNHQIKGGFVIAPHDLYKDLGNLGIYKWAGGTGEHWHVYPLDMAFYVQDRMEYGSLILNVGLRLDAFDPRTNGWDFWRPWNKEETPAPVREKPTHTKVQVSPRLGVSHPISANSALHFAYGIFARRPAFTYLFNNLNRNDIQDPGFGNPDVNLERTTAFEMGVQVEPIRDLYIDVTGYYRDMNNLVAYRFFTIAPGFNGGGQYLEAHYPLSYAYGDARGIEVTVKKRMSHHWAMRGAYTLSWGKMSSLTLPWVPVGANYSLPYLSIEETAGWDRRHNIVATATADLPFDIVASAIFSAQSGLPYRSAADVQTDPYGRRRKLSRLSWTKTLDLRVEKYFAAGAVRPCIFLDIRNLFNWENIYALADADWYRQHGDPAGPHGNPSVYGPPRDVYLGMSINW